MGIVFKHFLFFLFAFFSWTSFFGQQPFVFDPVNGFMVMAEPTVPITGAYFDHQVARGSQYFWEYRTRPLASMGFSAGYFRAKPVFTGSSGRTIFDFSLRYRNQVNTISYEGWEGGNSMQTYFSGQGKVVLKLRSALVSVGLMHEYFFGKKPWRLLHGLGLEAGQVLFSGLRQEREGTLYDFQTESPVNETIRSSDFWPSAFHIPDLKINYFFGVPFFSGKTAICPFFMTGLVNIAQMVPRPPPEKKPLIIKREYYKDFSLGLRIYLPSSS